MSVGTSRTNTYTNNAYRLAVKPACSLTSWRIQLLDQLIMWASFNCLLLFLLFFILFIRMGDGGGGGDTWELWTQRACQVLEHSARVLKIAPYGLRTIWHWLYIAWTYHQHNTNVEKHVLKCKILTVGVYCPWLFVMAEVSKRER